MVEERSRRCFRRILTIRPPPPRPSRRIDQTGDPYSAWQRGTNENTNGLIRQFFPKGTDLAKIPEHRIRKVQDLLNNRPRKRLGYWKIAKLHYRRAGIANRTLADVRLSLRPLRRPYGATPAREFGPRGLKAVRQSMIAAQLSRRVINNLSDFP